MMVKDEADILEPVLRHLKTQVDWVFVSDNGSIDGTPGILQDLQAESAEGWLTVSDDPEPGYFQSQKMTALADRAREIGHDWVVPVDADEVWYSDSGARMADLLTALPSRFLIAEAELYDHVATALDPDEQNPLERLGWRRKKAGVLPKVAARLLPGLVIEQGNHGAHYPGQAERIPMFSVRHFPYRSVEQFVRKSVNGAAAYAATDLPYDLGRHWREYGGHYERGGEAAISEIFHTWFWSADPEHDKTLIYDPALSVKGDTIDEE